MRLHLDFSWVVCLVPEIHVSIEVVLLPKPICCLFFFLIAHCVCEKQKLFVTIIHETNIIYSYVQYAGTCWLRFTCTHRENP